MGNRHIAAAIVVVSLAAPGPRDASAQLSEPASLAVAIGRNTSVSSNITYLIADNWEAKLDVYQSPPPPGRERPTLIYFHGGGWTEGDRAAASLALIPYLEMGWSVVNVDYRLARVSLAPGAVEDGRCALRWVIRNAKQYRFDVSRIVVSGASSGGHLALTTAMLPTSAGFDRRCPGAEELTVAAVINWGGITDVADLLEGPNRKDFAVAWLASLTNRSQIAKEVSPLTHVRAGLPPILTIRSDADPAVPYQQATRLHEALTSAGVSNTLLTLPSANPDAYSQDESLKAYGAIHGFLIRHGLLDRKPVR
jgi:acetyl esterase/lipase